MKYLSIWLIQYIHLCLVPATCFLLSAYVLAKPHFSEYLKEISHLAYIKEIYRGFCWLSNMICCQMVPC